MLASLVAALLPLAAHAQSSAIPLYAKHYLYDKLPYKVDTDSGERGPQYGYNQCNSTTEGPNSRCQTAIFNAIDDFCIWAPPKPNSTIGNVEGETVSFCTKNGRGGRVIPPGALTGVQFMKTPAYIQVTGMVDLPALNINAKDEGGEMDPHGADKRGNPLGGVVFSNSTGFPKNNSEPFQQVVDWNDFWDGKTFCFKACYPGVNASHFCEHRFDRIGCAYNSPSHMKPGVFESCEGDVQDFPGIYTENGAILTYVQPPEGVPIETLPYQPRVPASSNCVTYTSAQIYTASVSSMPPTSTSSSPSQTGSVPSGSGSGSGTAGTPSATSSTGAAVGLRAPGNDLLTFSAAVLVPLFGVLAGAMYI